jgi:hypothetical protein
MDTPVEEHKHRHRHRHRHRIRRERRRFAAQPEDRFLIVLAIVISLALIGGILWLLNRPSYKLW